MANFELLMPSTITPVGYVGCQLWQPLLKTDNDPALEVGDEFSIQQHYGTWSDTPILLHVVVSEIQRVFINGKMHVNIYVDVANKEVLPTVRVILKRLNPGMFE